MASRATRTPAVDSGDSAIIDTLVQLSDTLTDDYDVVDFLDVLVNACVDLVGVAGAGVMLDDQKGNLAVVASSSEAVRLLQILELRQSHGAAVECIQTGTLVTIPDLAAGVDGWPEFVQLAHTAGFLTGVAYPMRLRDVVIGSLEVFQCTTEPMSRSNAHLVQALANIALCYVPESRRVLFTTMERGHYGVQGVDGVASLADAVVERLAPPARSHLVIDNEFRTDLEPELWRGDAITTAIAAAGRRLDEVGLLPAPFPIEELLGERDLRHVKRLYGIGGLSYGNLSARLDAHRFWMSASGVDKSDLREAGRDILLVSGYDEEQRRMILSVPPDVTMS